MARTCVIGLGTAWLAGVLLMGRGVEGGELLRLRQGLRPWHRLPLLAGGGAGAAVPIDRARENFHGYYLGPSPQEWYTGPVPAYRWGYFGARSSTTLGTHTGYHRDYVEWWFRR